MEEIFVNIIGWIGVILMVLAYLLLVRKKLKSESLNYHILNIFGGLGVLVNSVYYKAWPIATLNIFWIGVALTGFIINKSQKNQKSKVR